jgi:hypothetical protein
MRRFTVVGLCFVAAFAFSAMAASSAFAGEYGNCVKSKTGKFIDSACLKKGSPGKYEWVQSLEKGTSKSKAASLKSAAGEITCKKSKDVSEILGWQKNKETTTFEQCELSVTKGSCTGIGNPKGTIVSTAFTYLIDHGTKGPSGLEPAEGEVWNEFQGAEKGIEGKLAEFVCEPGVIFRTSKTLSCPLTPVNKKPGAKSTLTCGAGKGEQDLNTEFSQDGGKTFNNTGPNTEQVTASIKTKPKTEIRACNEPMCEHEELPLPWL